MICPKCSAKTVGNERICMRCGTPLYSKPPIQQPVNPAPAPVNSSPASAQQPKSEKNNTGLIIGIVGGAVALVVILVIVLVIVFSGGSNNETANTTGNDNTNGTTVSEQTSTTNPFVNNSTPGHINVCGTTISIGDKFEILERAGFEPEFADFDDYAELRGADDYYSATFSNGEIKIEVATCSPSENVKIRDFVIDMIKIKFMGLNQATESVSILGNINVYSTFDDVKSILTSQGYVEHPFEEIEAIDERPSETVSMLSNLDNKSFYVGRDGTPSSGYEMSYCYFYVKTNDDAFYYFESEIEDDMEYCYDFYVADVDFFA